MYRTLLNRTLLSSASVAALFILAGCTESLPPTATQATSATAGKNYLLEQEPDGAQEVTAVRNEAEDQQDVVVVGRIGGRENPWVQNSAAFSIVDRSLKACNEIHGDGCTTPWDYCCEPNLPKSTLLVMIHDKEGKLVKNDARSLLGVKELDTVVVQGKAKRDEAGNVTLLTTKIYVSPDDKSEAPQ